MKRGCICDYPRPKGWRPSECIQCGRFIDPSYVSNDANLNEFFNHLASIPGVSPDFVEKCKARERAGRDEFGLKYLGSDRHNPKESHEEAADFAMYLYLHLLKCQRNGTYQDTATVMEACAHVASAWNLASKLSE